MKHKGPSTAVVSSCRRSAMPLIQWPRRLQRIRPLPCRLLHNCRRLSSMAQAPASAVPISLMKLGLMHPSLSPSRQPHRITRIRFRWLRLRRYRHQARPWLSPYSGIPAVMLARYRIDPPSLSMKPRPQMIPFGRTRIGHGRCNRPEAFCSH